MSKISLVISDVDGTLVTSEKVLTERARAAVARLHTLGIGFSIVSSRPPFGLKMFIEPLGLRLPIGVYNGGMLVTPDRVTVEQTLIPSAIVRKMIEVLRTSAVDAWFYAGESWMVNNPDGPHVHREQRTINTAPTVVENFESHLENVAKIVGVSDDFARLDACEAEVRKTIGAGASIVRSQRYYLDITGPGTNKGTAVANIARRLGIPAAEMVTLGDMENDIPMFRESGFSVAMGNASPAVQRCASAVTLSNDEDGFAAAIENIILPRIQAQGGSV